MAIFSQDLLLKSQNIDLLVHENTFEHHFVMSTRDRRVRPGPGPEPGRVRVRKSSIDRVQNFGTRRSPPQSKDQL